ncbi:hypothetical protein T02_4266 [Trichinella nativa]|uniref:Uncharacterized protein n=1 Tax=Trichinella nativa TaxID=6335 RepID=A0A0V1KP80_9BILA|nr:hypothetical protein T02_4266 [Trichinella nativa]
MFGHTNEREMEKLEYDTTLEDAVRTAKPYRIIKMKNEGNQVVSLKLQNELLENGNTKTNKKSFSGKELETMQS